MKTLETIREYSDGSKLKIQTDIFPELFKDYKWKQSVSYYSKEKGKWETAIKGLHYTDTCLKVERINFCMLLMDEEKKDGWIIDYKHKDE